MVAIAIAAVLLGQGPNLLENPALQSLAGWGPLYTRDPNGGTATLDDGPSGRRAVKIVSTDDKDWAFYQNSAIPVAAGHIYGISASIKAQTLTHAGISVVTMDHDGKVLDWIHAPVWTSGDHDWKMLSRRFVAPEGCEQIRFRLVGDGPGAVWMSNPSLRDLGSFPRFDVRSQTLRNSQLSLTIESDGSAQVRDAKGNRWSMGRPDPELLVRRIAKTSPSSATVELMDLDMDRTYAARYTLASSSPRVEIRIFGSGEMGSDLLYPGPIQTSRGDWLIVPMNEGILYPASDPTAPSLDLVAYGGHGISMPWYGVENPATGSGAMTILNTPDDAELRLERSPAGLLQPRPVWQPSRQSFRYPRGLEWEFFDSGGYVAFAKRYRRYAQQTGLLVTLAKKRETCPAVDRLVGAVNVWNWDMPVVPLAKELKQLGFDRVLWSRGGTPDEIRTLNQMGYLSSRYDIYQDVWDPKIALSWMNTAGWPDDLVRLPNGDWMKGWSHPDKQPDGTTHWIQGGVISSGCGLERAKKLIPAELKDRPYLCRFLDTTTASPFREDYNPLHPLSRTDDRKNKMALLSFCSRDMGLVVGSETGLDASVPYLEYFEGMMSLGPYRLPNAGTDMLGYYAPTPDFLKYQVGPYYRLPLWELVYHDCTVAQWYWGDATNKAPEVWNQRDLLNILYGTAPLLLFDQKEWSSEKNRMLRTYRNVCQWDRKIGYDELLSHEFLTDDHTVQRTVFSSGRSVIVNFGDRPWTRGKISVAPGGFEEQPPEPGRPVSRRS